MAIGQDMVETFITIVASSDKDAQSVSSSLAIENAEKFGPRDEMPLNIFSHDDTGELMGGLLGGMHWSWFYVRQLWVAERWRSFGIGSRLLAAAEAEAGKRACHGIYLDTFDDRVVSYYERHGFKRVGTIEGFPPGHRRTFLSKKLPHHKCGE